MKLSNIFQLTFLVFLLGACSSDPVNDRLIDFNTRSSHDYSPCLGEAEIAEEKLPSALLEYIETNHSGDIISEAMILSSNIVDVENENENEGENENENEDEELGSIEDAEFFIVELESGVEVLFDVSGEFIALQEEVDNDHDNGEEGDEDSENENENNSGSEHQIDINTLLPSITDYVASHYPDATIEEAESDVEFGMTFFELGFGEVTLIFDENGEFLCEG